SRVLAGLDLLLEALSLRAASYVHKRGNPVQGREHFFINRARLDVSGPADDERRAKSTLPCFTFLSLEGGDAAIGESYRLGAIVGCKGDKRVVELAHIFELFQDITDIVVHLFHAGFVYAPVLTFSRPQHV